MAGSSTSLSASLPKCKSAQAQVPNAAGTVAGKKPSPGIGSIFALRNHSTVAALPTQPWPLMATVLPSFGV